DGAGNPAAVDLLALRVSETQVAFIDGQVDVNTDGQINGNDDGILLSFTVRDGQLDTNNDGVIDANDVGLVLGHRVIAGRVDVNDDNQITAADDATTDQLSHGLANTGQLLGKPLRDVRVRVDHVPSVDGTWGQLVNIPFNNASNLPPPRVGDVLFDTVTGATGVVHLNAPGGPVGSVQVVQVRSGSFNAGSTLDLLDSLKIANTSAVFSVNEIIIGATSGARATVRR